MRDLLEKMLGPEGPLARNFSGYEPRSGQLAMSLDVARAFQEDDFALIEAGTGTGKTLAYLLPALMSGKKTIVSTGLKNLQDQIFEKDLPFIREFFGDNFKAARLKGLDKRLAKETGLFIHTPENPLLTMITGLGAAHSRKSAGPKDPPAPTFFAIRFAR